MKQSIFNLTIAIAALAITSVACNSKEDPQAPKKFVGGVQEDISVQYTLDDTCARIESIKSDSDPNVPDVVNYVTDEALQAISVQRNDSSNYELTVNEDEENGQFTIDLALNMGAGVNVHIVQSKEDFMNNSSVNVESIELQWLDDGTLNGEGTVELTGQEVNGESIELTFKFTEDFTIGAEPNVCDETLTITN